ncbi:fatty acid desaturase 4, chloroplastic-like [Rutidosis leptorrhynchoides]|uniref:fatty acid desaturase 4, chloroplastic-like n=1 Tax=Rutidosis leptorrhynchoides TaxID=125765 RepID=UPI003A99DCD4
MPILAHHHDTSIHRNNDNHKDCLDVIPKICDTPIKYDNPNYKSTWSHRVWVATGCTTILFSLTNSIIGSIGSHLWLEPILAGFVGYLFADLGSGVYHWAVDNYGDESTPLFGMQIDAFKRHHKWPVVITEHQFANHLHVIARAVTFAFLPINLIFHDYPIVMGFMASASGCIMFSMQFHCWAHVAKNKLPSIVVALQDARVLLSRSQHGTHHLPPYGKSYCIVSGVWNKFLDENKVFESLEMVVFFMFGVEPRSWSEIDSNWIQDKQISNKLGSRRLNHIIITKTAYINTPK